MAHFDLKTRYIAALPSVPPELELHLDEFIGFDAKALSVLAQEDKAFLLEHGLPRQASPFLSFTAYSPTEIQGCIDTSALPPNYFPIGQNGSGDLVAIDLVTREVIYFNHDAHNLRVFINSTLPQFAECLCIYQEHLVAAKMTHCLAAIERIDPRAAISDSMWHAEVMAEAANG